MTDRAVVQVAELRIVCDRGPTATLACQLCRSAHTVRGSRAVAAYIASNPLLTHRTTCLGRPAAAAA